MRINNKALAAVTAAALAFGAMTTPATAAEPVAAPAATINNVEKNKSNTGKNTGKNTGNKKTGTTNEGSSIKDMNPKDIKEWLAVITAVLSILGTVAGFVMKYMPQTPMKR